MKSGQKKETSTSDTKIEKSRDVYVGAWVGGFWDNASKKLTTSKLTDFENKIGKKMAIATIYSEWSYLSDKDLLTPLNTISDNGWTPLISSNPFFFDGCKDNTKSLYKTVADGDCDEFLKDAAANLRMYEKPILFRFAWEMNLPSMYWSVNSLKSTPEEFIAAWRHMHDIFKQEHADNVVWVLSFNTTSSNTIPYAQLYPGDEYVDWVAIDGYNWGTAQPWSKWTDFNGVFRKSYDELTSITDKPVMLSEVNSAPNGGNKAEWLRDMLSVQIPTNFPDVKAVIFFNEDKSKGENVDWRIEKSDENVSAIKNVLDNPLYKSDFP
jgi:endoglucanase